MNTLNLCNVPVCGVLTINVPAVAGDSPSVNDYTLVLDYFNTTITLTELQTEGEDIHFNVSGLNEDFQYTGKIYDSDGNLVTITDSPNTYDCIKFRTVVNMNGAAIEVLENAEYRILE